MRQVAHGVAWFSPETAGRVKKLMKLQCSASRSAYQAIHKHGLSGNAVKKYVKQNYMGDLNQRYVADACALVSGNKAEKVLFGGRRAWGMLQTGTLSKQDWRQRRDNRLYSRGDRTKNGNPNIRVVGEILMINDPSVRGKWLEGKLFLPSKWLPDYSCYDVRVLFRDGKFLVQVGWETPAQPEVTVAQGAVGIDTNPDGLGVAEVSADGNLLSHTYLKEQRIQFAGEGKRDYDVRQLAKKTVAFAEAAGKPLVIEKLSFSNKKRGHKKFRRMKSNFLHRKILEALKSRAARQGVGIIEVEPAFTSILGNLKYTKMYSLNRHTAAALVIARRGMGILEGLDFTVMSKDESGERLNLEGRGYSHTLSQKACSWLLDCFVKPKLADLTGPDPAPGWKPGIGSSVSENLTGESRPITGQPRQHVVLLGDERLPGKFSNLPKPGLGECPERREASSLCSRVHCAGDQASGYLWLHDFVPLR